MTKFILAKKVGMTQLYTEQGELKPVTVVAVEPNVVTGVRTVARDGYAAVQVGTGTRKRVSKPLAGHLKDLPTTRVLCEFRTNATPERGTTLGAETFALGDVVTVTATSKGKGFAGVVKRHGFKGGPASHGHPHNLRAPGSIGCRFPQHVHKGKRMAGHMGAETVTIRNLTVAQVDTEHQLIALTGAIPGARGTLVRIVAK